MPYVAAVPAIGLLAGAAVGLLLPSLPSFPAFLPYLPYLPAFLLFALLPCWWFWRAGRSRLFTGAVIAAFFVGGSLLSADAWQRAWRPPLRIAFEQLARQQRAQA